MNEVKGDAAKIKNITINIAKFFDKVENHFESGNQFDARRIKDAVRDTLLSVTNDFNYQE